METAIKNRDAKIKQLQAENENLKIGHKQSLYRIQYLLENIGPETTLILIEQTLKEGNTKSETPQE